MIRDGLRSGPLDDGYCSRFEATEFRHSVHGRQRMGRPWCEQQEVSVQCCLRANSTPVAPIPNTIRSKIPVQFESIGPQARVDCAIVVAGNTQALATVNVGEHVRPAAPKLGHSLVILFV